jgi:hypothetical protein
MARDFEVAKTQVADNASDVAGDIETFLDGLSIETTHTVYEITIAHYQGFWHIVAVYEA